MKVSIIISAYNGGYFLENYSLPSIISQAHSDWEAFIIDDGSTDNTEEVAKRFCAKEKRFKYIKKENNKGLANSMNLGVKISNGEIICFLEQDDIWLPSKLTLQLEQISRGKKIIFCNSFLFTLPKKEIYALSGGNLSSLMLTKPTANLIFPLTENNDLLGIEDGEVSGKIALLLTKKLLSENEIFNISTPLIIFSQSNNSLSGKRNPEKLITRYHAVIELFKNSKNSPELKKLLTFWKRHLFFNELAKNLPHSLRVALFFLTDLLKNSKRKLSCFNFQKKFEPELKMALNLIAKIKS